MTMAKLSFGKLTEAWKGEASDFTPLLAEQLDLLGDAIGVDLASVGKSEVATTGGRRIDIVATTEDGSQFVIENQYGRADHDHLTRGLAYAVASHARGLVVVAEEHRDEFRAVATYLNELADHDRKNGISVWLVEARAVRIGDSPWAPLFTAVVEPNDFTANVEQAIQADKASTLDDFYATYASPSVADALKEVVDTWISAGHKRRIESNHIVLEAAGPSASGVRTVVAVFGNGQVMVPFSSYAGQNSGIVIDSLCTTAFRSGANALFGFNGTEKQARTGPGWLTPDRTASLIAFCTSVADAYKAALVVQQAG